MGDERGVAIGDALQNRATFTTLELGQNGRLGNQLFQVAAVIGAAKTYNVGYMLPDWPVSRLMAGFPFPSLNQRTDWRTYVEPFFHHAEIPPPDPSGTSLWGFFQSWRYFDHCLPDIRSVFRPNVETLNRALAKLPGFATSANTGAIHLRRGDYQSANDYYLDLSAVGYYENVKQQARGFATRWYLFTDDPEWCRKNFVSRRSSRRTRSRAVRRPGCHVPLPVQCNRQLDFQLVGSDVELQSPGHCLLSGTVGLVWPNGCQRCERLIARTLDPNSDDTVAVCGSNSSSEARHRSAVASS